MTEPILTVSPKALRRVQEIRATEEQADRLALWVEVVGVARGEYAYDLYFDLPEEATGDDVVQHGEELTIVLPHESAELLRGATLDMSRDLLNPGLVIDNPNKPPQQQPQGIPVPDPSELSGPAADRVQVVLERHVNPQIAAHGGTAELVAVEGDTAYLRLGGGCQGCGQAAATLKHGIEVAIKQAVPEITSVVDVTDHAAGTNPYFEPSH